PVHAAVPGPADAARRRVRRGRLPVDRGGQHLGVQLPQGDRLDPLVRAYLRPRDRPEPAREPLRQRRADVASAHRPGPPPLAPAATAPGGMSRVTTAPAAMTDPVPIVQPSRTVTFEPTHTSSSMRIPLRVSPWSRIGRSRSSKRWLAGMTTVCAAIRTFAPID